MDILKADNLKIEKSRFSEVYNLAPRLRLDDKEEVKAGGSTPLEALKAGIRTSDECLSVYTKDGTLIGMFGYRKIKTLKDTAVIWFLGSDEIEKYPLALVKQGRKYIENLNKKYTLTNYVYSKNKTHINYLKHLKFIVEDNTPIEYNGEIFYGFYKPKKEV